MVKTNSKTDTTNHAERMSGLAHAQRAFMPLALVLALAASVGISGCANAHSVNTATTTQHAQTTEGAATTSKSAKTLEAVEVPDTVEASDNTETPDTTEALVISRVYENDYFYIDASSTVKVTVTDNGDNTWHLSINVPDYGGSSHLIHVGGTPAEDSVIGEKYAIAVGTTSTGQDVWREDLAGGSFISSSGEATAFSVAIGLK